LTLPVKNVVITGAATGLGRETAIQFAKAGANVAIWDFNEQKGNITVNDCKAYGVKSIFCKVDVRDNAQIEAAKDAVLKEFGTLDVLFSNAGVGA
jgi:NAD(P)-dependent dehydrogenase (short-subunit alcohol dehydrogenase family)